MKIYLIRHAESESNATKVNVGPSSQLSEFGIVQAKQVAHRLTSIPIDCILTSPYPRAKQTAEIIQAAIGREIHIHEDIHEVKSPSIVIGRSSDDPEIIAIDELRTLNFGDESWHHSDEENLADSRARARKFIAHLLTRSEKAIAVVTHGNFLRTLLAEMIFSDKLTADIYRSFAIAIKFDNTGITVVENRDNGSWRVLTVNDHSHLA